MGISMLGAELQHHAASQSLMELLLKILLPRWRYIAKLAMCSQVVVELEAVAEDVWTLCDPEYRFEADALLTCTHNSTTEQHMMMAG